MSDHVIGENATVPSIAYADLLKSDPPSWYRHISNTNLVVSDDAAPSLSIAGPKVLSVRSAG